jgi:hypothetical protein
MKQDPGELHNRIDDTSLADTARTLRDRLLRFYLETTDVVPLEHDKRDTEAFRHKPKQTST